MSRDDVAIARSQLLAFWRTVELFSPQSLPKVTRRSTGAMDNRVVDWNEGDPPPWMRLPRPRPLGNTARVWRHTVYLGVYEVEGIYETLHRVFADDADAYDERPGELSACAGLVVNDRGRVVVDASVLSSALWAVGRAHSPGPSDDGWMDGFDKAAQNFTQAVDDFQARLRDDAGLREPPVCDEDGLLGLMALAHRSAGIADVEQLATTRVRIESVAISSNRAEEAVETDFLNSFYLDDLALVRDRVDAGDVGAALARYLTPDTDIEPATRIDVVANPSVVDAATSIRHLPEGRWPSNPAHGLALSQQLAVNQALGLLGPGTGLMGVNGPPGTGKTTMLRDILAGNVVERAARLAILGSPGDAFMGEHRWTAEGGHPRVVPRLRPELTGFEMVVASANNAAVENVTAEIPAHTAIDQRWRRGPGYFTELATKVLQETCDAPRSDSGDPVTAWALVAATLGKKKNRAAFRSAFWFDPKTQSEGRDAATSGDAKAPPARPQEPEAGAVARMQTLLTGWAEGTRPRKPWTLAREEFRAAQARVRGLIAQRRAAEDRLAAAATLTAAVERFSGVVRDLEVEQKQLQSRRLTLRDEMRRHADAHGHILEQYDRIVAVRPTAIESLLSLGRASRRWRQQLAPAAVALTASQADAQTLAAAADRLDKASTAVHAQLATARAELDQAQSAVETNRAQRKADEQRYGKAYPGEEWNGSIRELRAPWLDADLDEARSELFLAALALHEDFIAAAAPSMLKGLRAANEVVAGLCPHNLEEHKRRAAWQLFFLVVPLVSTTFASASHMFGNLGSEALGWLMIDEAGQARPQYAAGAIWRAKRVIAVGDPMQLQPVVTIPQKAQRDIAKHYDVSSTWLAPRASVQTLADRVATYGTYLRQGDENVWVSAPLRVHRRCDDPMFTISNEIAYNGLMVNGVSRPSTADHPDPFNGDDPARPRIAASHWAHEPADQPGTHLQPGQIARLEKALAYLTNLGIEEKDIIAISPFRAVADRLSSLAKQRYPAMRAGTIHTAQGREAPVVILVLGGDPLSPGAKAWAATTPNLVNVAVSRAQRRLYVIGDRETWAQHNYFRELSAHLG